MTQPDPAGGAIQNTWMRVLLRGVLSVTATGQLLINCVSSSSMIYGKPVTHKHIKMCFTLGRLLSFRVDTFLILFLNLSFCVSNSRSPDTRIVPGIESQPTLVELTCGKGLTYILGSLGPGSWVSTLRNRPLGDDLAYFTKMRYVLPQGRKRRMGNRKSKANTLYIS